MTFERARSKENKEIRLNQIKEACIKLFDNEPYHEITLSKIGKATNFTRANLYKYVNSKEDIFILLVKDEFVSVVDDMKDKLIKDKPMPTEEFTHLWATILNEHQRFLKLVSLLFTMIEQNASVDALVDFKDYLAVATGDIFVILKHNYPNFDANDIGRLVDYIISFIVSRYPLCFPSKNQIEATKRSVIEYQTPDFVTSFADLLTLMINGIKLSKI